MHSHPVPFDQLQLWLDEAKAHPHITEPTAMALATATADAAPSVRMVLLKGLDTNGLVFYTNMQSQKGTELQQNPQAALCFYWMALGRQVRVQGSIAPVSDAQADAYYHSRSRGSQLGAHASKQSRPLESREQFMAELTQLEQQFEGKDIPRPDYWTGWCLTPDRFEFWEEAEFRLHNRERFTRAGDGWESGLLYP